MIRLGVHRAFPLADPSQVGEVRRAGVSLAEDLGFDETAAGRVGLVATELGHNLVRHAKHGELWLGSIDDARRGPQVELLSVDRGPGIAALAACMTDGYSTAGTPGTGLGAVRRLADAFDIHSSVPGGTLILARLGAAGPQRPPPRTAERRHGVGAVALPAPGEHECGDAWLLRDDGVRAALLVADGLGHGPDAAHAALAAMQSFERHPFDAPNRIVQQAHEALRHTRGAVLAVASLHEDGKSLGYSGVGNIAGRIISGLADRSFMSQHGTVGVQMRHPREERHDWPPHALLVMHSDGLASRWSLPNELLRHHPSLVAAWLMREHRRGSDDATVVVVRPREPMP